MFDREIKDAEYIEVWKRDSLLRKVVSLRESSPRVQFSGKIVADMLYAIEQRFYGIKHDSVAAAAAVKIFYLYVERT